VTFDKRHRLLAFALFALGFALVFRGWLFTGFDGAFGDEEDGYLALAIIEHWRHVFAGTVHWTDPIIFYPARGTLGYTDAFFLLGAADAALRGLGLDAFTAFMAVMAAVSAIGFFGFRSLAIRHFGVPPAFAAIGAFLFAFANLDAVKLIHVQAYCAMLLPVLCDLALSAWKRARGGAILAGVVGASYALMFLTAFQASWFFAFYLLLMALLYPAVFGRQATLALLREIDARRTIILAAAAGFAAGIVPFLVLYGQCSSRDTAATSLRSSATRRCGATFSMCPPKTASGAHYSGGSASLDCRRGRSGRSSLRLRPWCSRCFSAASS
jgi:hypothetical protein